MLCSQKANHNEKLDEIAKLLLDKGANPNFNDQNGNTPLHQTIMYQNIDVFKVLISNKSIQLDKQNKDGINAFGLCLERFQTKNSVIYRKLADLLIENGSDVNILNDKTGDTLLHLACKNKNEDAGEYLIKQNSIIDQYNLDGEEVRMR